MHNDIDRDLYEILGVERTATRSEIKSAYRRRARECHPDVARDDPEGERKFKELTFAYEILSDPEKRREYDTWGLEGLRRDAGIGFDGFSFSDLIDVFFGGAFGGPSARRRGVRVSRRGRDVQTTVSVDLSEVMTGTEREIELERLARCEECEGTGMMPGTHTSRCELCRGSGQITSQRRSVFGTFISSTTCDRCQGTGQVITEPCPSCGGDGRMRVVENLRIKIPPGVERGDHLIVREKGEGGLNGGKSGDLYVLVDVPDHPDFIRDGKDLLTNVTVDMFDAALGTDLEIKTLDGVLTKKIQPGTQPGTVLRARGMGLPERGGGKRGDMLITVDVSIPTRLDGEQKKLLKKLRDIKKAEAGDRGSGR